jgi:hypothetical protein
MVPNVEVLSYGAILLTGLYSRGRVDPCPYYTTPKQTLYDNFLATIIRVRGENHLIL